MKLEFHPYGTGVPTYVGTGSPPYLSAQSKGATPRLIGLSAAPVIKVSLLTLLSGISHRD